MPSSLSNIWQLPLRVGESDHPANGACAMDAVSWLVEGRLGDHPKCVCPVITDYVINLNDTFEDVERQQLRTRLLRLIDTVDKPNAGNRTRFVIRHAMTVLVPLMLEQLPGSSLTKGVAEICREWHPHAIYGDYLYNMLHKMPRPEVTGIADNIAFHLQRLLPLAAPVFNGPSSMTMLPYYLMLELRDGGTCYHPNLHPSIIKGLWDGLDGLLAIGRQAPENYLDQIAIDHANRSFKEAALDLACK
jgi:hypothetical protein